MKAFDSLWQLKTAYNIAYSSLLWQLMLPYDRYDMTEVGEEETRESESCRDLSAWRVRCSWIKIKYLYNEQSVVMNNRSHICQMKVFGSKFSPKNFFFDSLQVFIENWILKLTSDKYAHHKDFYTQWQISDIVNIQVSIPRLEPRNDPVTGKSYFVFIVQVRYYCQWQHFTYSLVYCQVQRIDVTSNKNEDLEWTVERQFQARNIKLGSNSRGQHQEI